MRFCHLSCVSALFLVPFGPIVGASRISAQESGIARPSVDRAFAGGADDSALVHLERGRVYRAELAGPRGELRIEHARRRSEPALVVPIPARSVVGRAVFEVYARESGTHVLRVSGLRPGEAVQVRLDADSIETQAQELRREDRLARKWTLGLRGGAGRQSSFALSPTVNAGGGISLDGALRFASAGFPVALALGVTTQAASDDSQSITWFYAEPEVRVLRSGNLELALLGRFAMGNAERVTIDPSVYGGGVQLMYAFRDDPAHRGPAAHVRYSFGTIQNAQVDGETMHMAIAGIAWTF